jgi:ATP-binding cassette subfamily C protein LapB
VTAPAPEPKAEPAPKPKPKPKPEPEPEPEAVLKAPATPKPALKPAPAQEADHTPAPLEPAPSQVDFYPPMLHCLSILFKLHGRPVSPNIIASRLASGKKGSMPSAILRAAKAAGMDSKIVAKPVLDKIHRMTLPVILMLQNEGACVLTSYDEENAKVIFPENDEPIEVPRAELEKDYIGYAVFAKLGGRLDDRAEKLQLLDTKKWFWGTLVSFLPIYKHVFYLSFVVNAIALSSPLFFMNVYDKVLPNKLNALDTLWALTIGVLLTYIFEFILKNLRSYFVDLAGHNADVLIANKLMQQVLNMRLDAKPDSVGSLANNLREFESLREFFSSSTMTVLVDLPFFFIFLGVISFISGWMVLVPLAAIPIILLLGVLVQFPMQHTAEKGFKENMQKNALLFEMINGLETIKTSMAEGRMMSAWDKVVGMSALSHVDSKRMSNISVSSSITLAQVVSAGIIVMGVYLYNDGLITMGGIIACNMLTGRAMAPLSQLSGMFARLQQSRMALKALDVLMHLPTENIAGDSTVDVGYLAHSLSVEGLNFKYPGNERGSLEQINLNINPNEKIGVIGPMGSGKSTLGRLCVGLYQPTEGAVKMGGVDIRQLDTVTLRSRFGYASQDNYLFYGTVRENIAFGAVNVDDRMILRAANIAGVTDFVRSHPAGFGMQVGERGMNLSGGQRQSVAIARALLRDPDILILDEPSSNMDNYAESLLKQRLNGVIGGKTVLIITHRMSMLELVNRIIVLDSGKIVADGPKTEILEKLKKERLKRAEQMRVQAQAQAQAQARSRVFVAPPAPPTAAITAGQTAKTAPVAAPAVPVAATPAAAAPAVQTVQTVQNTQSVQDTQTAQDTQSVQDTQSTQDTQTTQTRQDKLNEVEK